MSTCIPSNMNYSLPSLYNPSIFIPCSLATDRHLLVASASLLSLHLSTIEGSKFPIENVMVTYYDNACANDLWDTMHEVLKTEIKQKYNSLTQLPNKWKFCKSLQCHQENVSLSCNINQPTNWIMTSLLLLVTPLSSDPARTNRVVECILLECSSSTVKIVVNNSWDSRRYGFKKLLCVIGHKISEYISNWCMG